VTNYIGPLFQHINDRVSHHCLSLLTQDLKRMQDLSDEIEYRCGCAFLTTHEIPCACTMYECLASGDGIYLEQIHSFWKTLVIGEGVQMSEFVDQSAQDVEHFRKLVDEISESDPAVIRSASRILYEQLHPDQSNYGEPEENTKVRGRPRGKSTRRDPSAFEYAERGRGRSGSSGSRGRGRSSNSFRSSVNTGT